MDIYLGWRKTGTDKYRHDGGSVVEIKKHTERILHGQQKTWTFYKVFYNSNLIRVSEDKDAVFRLKSSANRFAIEFMHRYRNG